MELTEEESASRHDFSTPCVTVEWSDWLRFQHELPTTCCMTSSHRAQQGFDPEHPDQVPVHPLHPLSASATERIQISVEPDEIEAEAVDIHIQRSLQVFQKLRSRCEE